MSGDLLLIGNNPRAMEIRQQRDDLMTLIDTLEWLSGGNYIEGGYVFDAHELGHHILGEDGRHVAWSAFRAIAKAMRKRPPHDVAQDIARRLEDIFARRMPEAQR